MEAGIIALMLLLGYSFADGSDNPTEVVVENKSQDVDTPKDEKIMDEFDYQVIGNLDQRFFEKTYQLQIKQFHYESQVKKIDSLTNLSVQSADLLTYTNKFNDFDKNGQEIETTFKIKTQLLPTDTNQMFDLSYIFNHKEMTLDQTKVDYTMKIEDRIDLYLNKVFIVTYKNNQYELRLKDVGESAIFKNIERLDCNNDITCEILKENTIQYKKTKTASSYKSMEFGNKELKSKADKKTIKATTKQSYSHKERVLNNGKEIRFPDYKIHKVKSGETLSSLSKKYDVPSHLMKGLNDLESTSISVGQDLVIVNKTTLLYKVAYGDTLFKISKRYNKKISSIKKMNGLVNDKINDGQTLVIKY